MPYIKKEDRCSIELSDIAEDIKRKGPGFANFVISSILYEAYGIIKNPSYTKYNEAMGVLAAAQAEMARRFAPYEQGKLELNGDISL